MFCLYPSSPISHRGLIVLKTYLWMSPLIWVQTFFFAILASRDTDKTVQGIRFLEKVIIIFLTILINRYPVAFCLYLGSLTSHRKLLVLKTYLWLSPFICGMSQLLTMFTSWARMPKSYSCVFFKHPVYKTILITILDYPIQLSSTTGCSQKNARIGFWYSFIYLSGYKHC